MNWKDLFPKENRYFETKNGILYCGNCLEIIKEFPENSIDLVLIDPPYTNILEVEWDKKDVLTEDLINNFRKIIKDHASIYVVWYRRKITNND